MNAGNRDAQGRSRSPGKRSQQRRIFAPGAVSAVRAVDTRGARFLCTIEGVDGLVSAELIGEYKLAMGRVLSESEAESLTKATHQLQVFDRAVSLLAVRPRSARDLQRALRRRGATDEETRAAIARLSELRLVDDASYARELTRSKAVGGGISRRRLQQELLRRGVAPKLAREAMSEVLDDVGLDERESALAVARKRLRSLGGLDPATTRRRLYAFLARRGYASAVVSGVIAEVLGRSGDDLTGEG